MSIGNVHKEDVCAVQVVEDRSLTCLTRSLIGRRTVTQAMSGGESSRLSRNRGDKPKTSAAKRTPLELLLPGAGTHRPWRP